MNDVSEPIIVETPPAITVLEAVFRKLRSEWTAVIMLGKKERHELMEYIFGLEERSAGQLLELENARTAALVAADEIKQLQRIEELAAKTVFGYRENQDEVHDALLAEFVEEL